MPRRLTNQFPEHLRYEASLGLAHFSQVSPSLHGHQYPSCQSCESVSGGCVQPTRACRGGHVGQLCYSAKSGQLQCCASESCDNRQAPILPATARSDYCTEDPQCGSYARCINGKCSPLASQYRSGYMGDYQSAAYRPMMEANFGATYGLHQ